MSRSPLDRVVDRLKSEPSRTGSLVMTFYGDAVVPRGGSVWLGTLLAFFELLEIDGGVVRTAVSRLAADGWLARDKQGRKSFYRLAPASRERFETGIQHVYRADIASLEAGLELILIGNASDREASRAALIDAGFGSPMPGVWVAPAGVVAPPVARDFIKLDVSAADGMGRRLIRDSWPLPAIATSYRDFIETFQPLEASLNRLRELTPAEAILARVLLIHHYRRVLLRDPLLPAEFLPSDWPAVRARQLCGKIYRSLIPPSERWLDEFGVSIGGAMKAADPALAERFQAVR